MFVFLCVMLINHTFTYYFEENLWSLKVSSFDIGTIAGDLVLLNHTFTRSIAYDLILDCHAIHFVFGVEDTSFVACLVSSF